jgi:hypothetical protein
MVSFVFFSSISIDKPYRFKSFFVSEMMSGAMNLSGAETPIKNRMSHLGKEVSYAD